MKNWYKNQKGSMTAYAIITIFCFIFILTALFLSSASIRKRQLRSIIEIAKAYQRDKSEIEKIYRNRQRLDTSKYVQDGLVLFYDGINNTGNGHSNNATTWKDLSTSNFNGTLMNFEDNSWTNNSLTFDGIDDWVKIAQMDYPNITMEIIMEYDNYGDSQVNVIGNWQNGGYGIVKNEVTYKDSNAFSVYLLGKSYQYIQSNNLTKIGKKYILTGSYDGSTMKLWENGIKNELSIEGTIGNPQNNTIMVLGANPDGSNYVSNWFTGKIYAVRIYNRALTDEEVKQNYELDIQRYGVEDNLQ